ncbi:MAG: amino acid ABC transporter permease [Verrucomicrobiales bacterium]|nr:amino acid ABC transporter permease [Verrucomicrobiales bacterium]
MKSLAGWLLFAILFSGLCFLVYVICSHDFRWDAMSGHWRSLRAGWLLTLGISFVSLLFSLTGASILAAGRLSPLAPTRWLATGYVEVIRGTPLLVQIFIGFYMVAHRLGLESKFWVGTLVLSCFAAAYLAEIFRAGIESIPRSQWESGRAIGLTTLQIYRHVVIPQAVRRVLPGTAGQFANLIKDSSLLYVIGISEFTARAREVNSATYATYESYLPLAVGYLILTLPISMICQRLEARFRYEH